jgi:hypothetical protein
MRRSLLLIVCLVAAGSVFAQKTDSWNDFAKTKFEPKYNEKLGEYVFYPNFAAELKALEGKEITIQGFYVPFAPEDGEYIIISKYPMSQCFFCGGGGPESIAEVNFAKSPGKFQVDDLITLKGKLRLNADNLDHMNFILDQAVLVSK